MTQQALLVELQDQVLTLTINRPEQRNALSLALLDELGETLHRHADAEALKFAVITATGDRCFAAGGDLKELDAYRTPEQAREMSQRGRRALDAVREFPLPVVAALNGLALGGGAELAMACDLRVAHPRAEIGFLQGQLNVTTAWGGGIDLIAAVGPQRALELLLAARRVPAAEAQRIGLVSRVCGEDEPLSAAVADFIAPWRARSAGVMRGFKALTSARRRSLHAALTDVEEDNIIATWIHDDHWQAVAAGAKPRT